MEISYKRDVNHSFLVIRPENVIDTKAYPVRMVLGNVIPGLLPCRLQKADGDILLYYDITARQLLSDVYQKLTYTELKEIYQGFLKIFEQMEMYLLNADQLLLEPEYVYVDKKEGTMHLCYLPGYGKPVREQLRSFTEYLLPRMEHQDSKGVMFGYSIYRLMVEDGFQMEAVRELLHKSEKTGKEPKQYTDGQAIDKEMMDVPEEMGHIEQQGNEREDKVSQKKIWVKDLALLLIALFLFGGFAVSRQMGYFTYVSLPVMLAVLFCIVLGTGAVLWADKRVGKKKGEREKIFLEDVDKDPEERDALWENAEPPEFLHREIEEVQEETIGEETVILYRSPEYSCPALVSEEAGQAPPIILNREMIVIGKMDGVSDVLLDRPSISRIHAKIQKKEQDYWIGDLNSKNGTFINGKKLEKEEEHLLQPEDQVVFADIRYRFIKNG